MATSITPTTQELDALLGTLIRTMCEKHFEPAEEMLAKFFHGDHWRDALATLQGLRVAIMTGDSKTLRKMARPARVAIRSHHQRAGVPPVQFPVLRPTE